MGLYLAVQFSWWDLVMGACGGSCLGLSLSGEQGFSETVSGFSHAYQGFWAVFLTARNCEHDIRAPGTGSWSVQ